MNKIINPFTVALYAFIVGYAMTAIFTRIPVFDNFIANSIFILIITILIVIGTALAIKNINRRHIEKQETENK